MPIIVLGPGIEMKVNNRRLALRTSALAHYGIASDEYRPAVAGPTAVGGMDDELDTPQVRPRPAEVMFGRILFGPAANEYAHSFAGGNFARNFAIDSADGIEFIRPICGVVRPTQPGGFVRLPLCGHGEAE